VLTHAFHNTLGGFIGGFEGLAIGTLVDWSGWLIMFVFVLFMIYHEKNLVKIHLQEEVDSGLITNTNYIRALSPFTMSPHFGRPVARPYFRFVLNWLIKKNSTSGNQATCCIIQSSESWQRSGRM
jgi:hypothetical protein